MSNQYLEISVIAMSDDEAEAVADVLRLFAINDEGVAIEQLGDPDNLDAKAMLPQQKVNLYVDVGRDSAELRQKITQALRSHNLPTPTFTILDPIDWTTAWKKNYHPLSIGEKFLILPSWETLPENTSDKYIIKLDPGMAFGSGTHPTTQLCLSALEKIVQSNDSVFDVGCGSGILSIGASLLGASDILAVDTDADAVRISQENIAANGNLPQIQTAIGSHEQANNKQFDIIIANILAVILLDLLEEGILSCLKTDGTLLLSGILDQQIEQMTAKIESVGGSVYSIEQLDDWVAILCKKKA